MHRKCETLPSVCLLERPNRKCSKSQLWRNNMWPPAYASFYLCKVKSQIHIFKNDTFPWYNCRFVCATIWHINNVFFLPISSRYCCQEIRPRGFIDIQIRSITARLISSDDLFRIFSMLGFRLIKLYRQIFRQIASKNMEYKHVLEIKYFDR